jgi:hypothetical protein
MQAQRPNELHLCDDQAPYHANSDTWKPASTISDGRTLPQTTHSNDLRKEPTNPSLELSLRGRNPY